jgi:hypothetical protein
MLVRVRRSRWNIILQKAVVPGRRPEKPYLAATIACRKKIIQYFTENSFFTLSIVLNAQSMSDRTINYIKGWE